MARRTFNAAPYAALIAEVPQLIGPAEMREVMGATRAELNSLARDGVLVPRTAIPTVRTRWRASDGLALLDELRAMAVPVAGDDRDWEKIQGARKRRRVPAGELIAAMRDGQLPVGRREWIEGYGAFVVPKAAVDELSCGRGGDRDGPPDRPALLSASAFARRIGIREGGRFLRFLRDGHTPATPGPHPETGESLLYLGEADIAAFHDRFATPTTLAAETGLHWRTVQARLKAGGAEPFASDGADYGSIYLRSEIVKAFA